MNLPGKYDGIRIGVVFMLACLSLVVAMNTTSLYMLAVLVGVVSVGPISLIESVTSSPESATVVSAVVLVIFLASILWVIRLMARKEGRVPKFVIILSMLLMYFPIQVLGFYVYWKLESNFQGGNQAMMLTMNVAPITSWVFVLVGWSIDTVKNKTMKTDE